MKIFLFLPLLITLFSHVALPGYDFKTLDKTGALSNSFKETLTILDIDPHLPALEALSLLEKKYGRKPNQERHELDQSKKIENNKESLTNLITELGMVAPVFPSQKTYDFIIVHGSTIETMRERLDFLLSLLAKKKVAVLPETQFFFITGDRDLFPHEDIFTSESYTFREGWVPPCPKELPKTEGEAAYFVIDQLIQDASLRKRFKVLIAPKRYDQSTQKWVRPHTGNTVEILIDHLKSVSVKEKKFLFISNNPYIAYQNAIASREFLKRSFSASVETVGPQTNKKITIVEIDNLRNTLQRELEVWQQLQKKVLQY